MCINAFSAARFETDLRRQWISAGLLMFSHKKVPLPLSRLQSLLVLRWRVWRVSWRGCPFPTTHCALFSSRKCLVTRLDMTYVMSFSWKNRSCSVVSAWTSPFHFHYFPTIYLLSWSFKLYNEVVFLLNRWSSFNTSNKALPSSFDVSPLTVFLLFYFQNRWTQGLTVILPYNFQFSFAPLCMPNR